MSGVHKISGPPMRDLKGYMRPEEVKKVIEHGRRVRDRLIMRMLWVTGCRLNELLLVTVGDISWQDKTIVMWTLKRKEQNVFQRLVQVDSKTLNMMKAYCKTRGIKKGKIFRICDRRVEQIVYEAGKAAGISRVGIKKIHPHHFRHSHSVNWVRKNPTMEGLRKLQKRLGHASIATTAHYLQFATSEQEPDVEAAFGEW